MEINLVCKFSFNTDRGNSPLGFVAVYYQRSMTSSSVSASQAVITAAPDQRRESLGLLVVPPEDSEEKSAPYTLEEFSYNYFRYIILFVCLSLLLLIFYCLSLGGGKFQVQKVVEHSVSVTLYTTLLLHCSDTAFTLLRNSLSSFN